MPLEEWFVYGYVLDRDNVFLVLLQDPVNHQVRIALWKNLPNVFSVTGHLQLSQRFCKLAFHHIGDIRQLCRIAVDDDVFSS